MKIIITTGKFDLIHSGHLNLLTYCRALAGETGQVIVALDSDNRISKKNPMLPIIQQDFRKINLQVLRFGMKQTFMVDKVVIFNTDGELRKLIESSQADYIVKGSDWTGKEIIGSEHATVIFCPTSANGVGDKISSSKIIEMVLRKYSEEEDGQ